MTFEPSITLGSLASIVAMLVGVLGLWFKVSHAWTSFSERATRLETLLAPIARAFTDPALRPLNVGEVRHEAATITQAAVHHHVLDLHRDTVQRRLTDG